MRRKAEILPLPQKSSTVYLVSILDFTEIGTNTRQRPHRASKASPPPGAAVGVLALPGGLDARSCLQSCPHTLASASAICHDGRL